MSSWTKRSLVTAAAALVVVAVAACTDDSAEYPPVLVDCSEYTTCGTCTPALGCGWCFGGAGQGTCAADPSLCPDAASFTWNPPGCFVEADASVVEGGFTLPEASVDGHEAAVSSDGGGD